MEWDIIGEEVKAEDGEEAKREEEDTKIKGVKIVEKIKMELEEIEEGVKEVVKEGVTMYMVQVLMTPEQHLKSLSI